jgi:hypothetical protein
MNDFDNASYSTLGLSALSVTGESKHKRKKEKIGLHDSAALGFSNDNGSFHGSVSGSHGTHKRRGRRNVGKPLKQEKKDSFEGSSHESMNLIGVSSTLDLSTGKSPETKKKPKKKGAGESFSGSLLVSDVDRSPGKSKKKKKKDSDEASSHGSLSLDDKVDDAPVKSKKKKKKDKGSESDHDDDDDAIAAKSGKKKVRSDIDLDSQKTPKASSIGSTRMRSKAGADLFAEIKTPQSTNSTTLRRRSKAADLFSDNNSK